MAEPSSGVALATKGDEQHPLLVMVVGGERQAGVGSRDGVDAGTAGRAVRACRSRAKHLARGAALLIDKWPDYISTCWMMIFLFLVGFLGVCIIVAAITSQPSVIIRIPKTPNLRCLNTVGNGKMVKKGLQPLPKVFIPLIVNADKSVSSEKYLPILSDMIRNYSNVNFCLIFLTNDTNDYITSKVKLRSWFRESKIIPSVKIQSDIVVSEKFSKFLTLFNNVEIQSTTLSQHFSNTPLKYRWYTISPQVLPFIVRMFIAWDNGGIVLDMNHLDTLKLNPSKINQIFNSFTTLKPDIKKELLKNEKSDFGRINNPRTDKEFLSKVSGIDVSIFIPSLINEMKEMLNRFSQNEKQTYKVSDKNENEETLSVYLIDTPQELPTHKNRIKRSLIDSNMSSTLDTIKNDTDHNQDNTFYNKSSMNSNSTLSNPMSDVTKNMNAIWIPLNTKEDQTNKQFIRPIQKELQGSSPNKFVERKQTKDITEGAFVELEKHFKNNKLNDYPIILPRERDFDMNGIPQLSPNTFYFRKYPRYKSSHKLFHHNNFGNNERDKIISYPMLHILPTKYLNDFPPISPPESIIEYFKPHMSFKEMLTSFEARDELLPKHDNPDFNVLTLDKDGHIFATLKPCHAFIGQLISVLRSAVTFNTARELIDHALTTFCRTTYDAETVKDRCRGINLI